MGNLPFDPLGFLKPEKLLSWDGIMSRGLYEEMKKDDVSTEVSSGAAILKNNNSVQQIEVTAQRVLSKENLLRLCKQYHSVVICIGEISTSMYGFSKDIVSTTCLDVAYAHLPRHQQYAISKRITEQFLQSKAYVQSKMKLDASDEYEYEMRTIELRNIEGISKIFNQLRELMTAKNLAEWMTECHCVTVGTSSDVCVVLGFSIDEKVTKVYANISLACLSGTEKNDVLQEASRCICAAYDEINDPAYRIESEAVEGTFVITVLKA